MKVVKITAEALFEVPDNWTYGCDWDGRPVRLHDPDGRVYSPLIALERLECEDEAILSCDAEFRAVGVECFEYTDTTGVEPPEDMECWDNKVTEVLVTGLDQPDYSQLCAYSLGYYHGRAIGTDEGSPYDPDDPLRQLYNDGYDAGVGDYCRENHPEAEEEDKS